MTYAIETHSLTKQFPKTKGWRGLIHKVYDPPVVNDVSIMVSKGELFGLVGPNGAGKTTLIKMLSTLILPSAGSVLVNGYSLRNAQQIKQTVGLVTSDERSFFWRLTGTQNLEFFAALDQIPRNETQDRVVQVMALMGLQDLAAKPFQTYSTGMRQRLSIARALLSNPKLLFLDEPTKGLDPESSHQLQDIIQNQLSHLAGVTVFMASHNLEEVEQICDRVAIMRTGKIIACGTMDELRAEIPHRLQYEVQVQGYPTAAQTNTKLDWVPNLQVETDEDNTQLLRFNPLPNEDTLDRFLTAIREDGGKIQDISRKNVSLDSIFSHLTQQTPDKVAIGKETKKHPPSHQVDVRSRDKGFPIRDFFRVLPAFLKRDFQLEISYRLAFFLQFFGIFFSIAVYYFISRLIGDAASPYLEAYGGDYFSFVLIGIAFSGYFGVGLSSFSSSLRQAQTTGTLEAMLSTPTSFAAIILSSSLWSYLMTTLRVLVYLSLGALFLQVDLQSGNISAALIILILTVISFSSLGILAASFIMVLKRGNPVIWLFGSLSSLFGGVYFPITVMPAWLQTFSYFIPVTYSLRGMRLALLQDAPFSALTTDILALLGFSLVLLPLGLLSFRFAVNKARADGSLTHY